jgi:hypothetical protein
MPHCEGGIPIFRFVAGWPQECPCMNMMLYIQIIQRTFSSRIFNQIPWESLASCKWQLQQHVTDGMWSQHFFTSARIHWVSRGSIKGGIQVGRTQGRDMQKCREVFALTRAQPTTIVDRSCSTRGSSCAKRIAACTYPDPSCEETPQPEKLRSKLEPFLLVASVWIDVDMCLSVDSWE